MDNELSDEKICCVCKGYFNKDDMYRTDDGKYICEECYMKGQ